MAYLESVSGQVITALRAEGLTVFTEYELQTAPIPQDDLFLTVAVAGMQTDAPLDYPQGIAAPAEVQLRIRLHGRVGNDPDDLAICWELRVLPVLLDSGLALHKTSLGEAHWERRLDRMVREGTAALPALLTRTES